MSLDLSSFVEFFSRYQEIFIFLLLSAFFVFLWLLVSRAGRGLFSLYRRNFFNQIDGNLRDALILVDPRQVFAYTLVAACVIGPLVFIASNLLLALVVVVVILFMPTYIVRKMKERRADQVVKQLPDTLASMSSSLRSGLNLVKSLQQVCKNQPDPIAQEFAQVLVEYRVGTDLDESFDDLARRMNRREIILMNSAIKISRSVGGNLADTFDILAKTLREKAKVEGKVKAVTSMGRSQGQLAIIFPIFMGYVFYKMEPAAISMLFTTPLGLLWFGVMVFMAVMAIVLIRKAVSVDI